MNRVLTFAKFFYLFILMVVRNIRWLVILCFFGKERPWKVLDFQMNLSARTAGLDLKEDNIHKQLILDRAREQKATKIIKHFIHPDDVILELGANIGYYVLIESAILSDKGHIYAVEPCPENIELLKKNVALNNVKNIEIYNMAASDTKGTAELYVGKASNLHSLIDNSRASSAKCVQVETDTVDNILKGKKPVTLLRMDIEGYEATVIYGMKETLKSPELKRMFIEIHPNPISSNKMQHLLKLIRDNGFEIKYAVSHDNWQRAVLGQCKVEEMTVSQLAQDKRILQKKCVFEVFFEKSNN